MRYNPDIHHRRSIRLPKYNYTQNGAYFITICTDQKQPLFGQIADGTMQLNHLGYIARDCWLKIPQHFSHIQLDTFVIMPDHIHGILQIVPPPTVGTRHCRVLNSECRVLNSECRVLNSECRVLNSECRVLNSECRVLNSKSSERFSKPVRGSISTAVRSYKSAVTNLIHRLCETKEVPIWQSRFYESVIRDKTSLNYRREYIRQNPIRWFNNPEKMKQQQEFPVLLDLRF
jgi:putative transposase